METDSVASAPTIPKLDFDLADLGKMSDVAPRQRSAALRGKNKALRDGVQGIYGLIGIVTSVRCGQCGEHIIASAEQRAEEWLRLAETNATVRRTLEALISASAIGEVAIGNLTMLLVVFIHHGILPASVAKVFTPEPSEDVSATHAHTSNEQTQYTQPRVPPWS